MKWLKELQGFWKWVEGEYERYLASQIPNIPSVESIPPVVPVITNTLPMPIDPDSIVYPWDSPKHNYHNTRVLCDLAELTTEEKNLICACIYRESGFNNDAVNHNKDKSGNILSTDFGICQINDYYHIGFEKDFPTVDYVLSNPDKAVSWMIDMYQHGMLKQWVSYSSGAYKQFLLPSSPMWDLKS